MIFCDVKVGHGGFAMVSKPITSGIAPHYIRTDTG